MKSIKSIVGKVDALVLRFLTHNLLQDGDMTEDEVVERIAEKFGMSYDEAQETLYILNDANGINIYSDVDGENEIESDLVTTTSLKPKYSKEAVIALLMEVDNEQSAAYEIYSDMISTRSKYKDVVEDANTILNLNDPGKFGINVESVKARKAHYEQMVKEMDDLVNRAYRKQDKLDDEKRELEEMRRSFES